MLNPLPAKNSYETAARNKKVNAFLDAFDSVLGRPIVAADMDRTWPVEQLRKVYALANIKKASEKTLDLLADRIREREEKLKAGQVWKPGELPTDPE